MSPVPFSQSVRFAPRAEFFVKRAGVIVKSAKVFPSAPSDFTSDGVRMRLNMGTSPCRAMRANNIRASMVHHLALPPDTTISLTGRAGLHAASGAIYLQAMGYAPTIQQPYAALNDTVCAPPQRLLDLLDATLGNLGVIIDPRHAKRTPGYTLVPCPTNPLMNGFTYDTVGNWWLGAYQLMSLAFGLCRFCVLAAGQTQAYAHEREGVDYVTPILSKVKMTDVRRAITTGDVDLALANWSLIEDEVISGMAGQYGNYPFGPLVKTAFRHFLSRGTTHWFNHDLLTHWRTLPDGHNTGWEAFLSTTVTADLAAQTQA